MRHVEIFTGSSHPALVDAICSRLGQNAGKAELGKFSNGETQVQIHTSIREKDVFIVQSGSNKINDNVVELLIMISACKSGSSKSITAVMPYFPYSRQSKKKSHRGSITAKMIANMLKEAGVDHVITIDLHSSQMQGFFHCPVDNLVAEPLIAHWIKAKIPDWQKAVVVSKNPGGTKRVTSLADVLKLNFGIVMTDRCRPGSGTASMANSAILGSTDLNGEYDAGASDEDEGPDEAHKINDGSPGDRRPNGYKRRKARRSRRPILPSSPLTRSMKRDSLSPSPPLQNYELSQIQSAPSALTDSIDGTVDQDQDPRYRDIITGRLVHGHIVDDDAPSPSFSARSSAVGHDRQRHGSEDESVPDHMISSFVSTASSVRASAANALGGSADAVATSDEEEKDLTNPELESTVTLVGNVKGRTVLIMDDMIDKPTSWIAAAETVVKRGGATKVFCIATHGLFGGKCLEEMEECDCIDHIVVTNAFPVPVDKARTTSKLAILDVSNLLAEAIRRNHFGESISALFQTIE